MVAASGLLITGLVSSWELIQNLSKNPDGTSASETSSSTASIQPPPSPDTTSQTTTEQQTVTVTEYVSGPSTQQGITSQQSASSSQASQQTSQVTSSTAQQAPAGYILVASMSALAGKTSAYFNHPSHGLSLLVSLAGQWIAFSATCTHAPCTVQYNGSTIRCPCHGGTYNPSTGAVQSGPPPAPLPQYGVLIQNNNLYVTA